MKYATLTLTDIDGNVQVAAMGVCNEAQTRFIGSDESTCIIYYNIVACKVESSDNSNVLNFTEIYKLDHFLV